MNIPFESETLRFIQEHLKEDARSLALQAGKYPLVDMSTAVTQIAGRQSVENKIPSWYATDGLIYPKHLSLEQCSSEATAHYKASLLKGNSLVDLTGGFGIDCAFMAANFEKATYIERQPELCDMARHNFPILGLHHIEVINADSETYLRQMNKADCIFIDPARRNENGGKTIAISDCEPNVKELSTLLLEKADTVLIKLSPMLDLTLALRDMPSTQEAYIVSVNNECKELILVLSHTQTKEQTIHCVNLTKNGIQTFSFIQEKERESNCLYAKTSGAYLYEPNASILKAGAYKSLAHRYNVEKLHPSSHLYTSNELIKEFPGRVFQCNSVFSLNKKELKEELAGITKANITVRNFPCSVDELRKRTKLKDGGDIYLFATTLSNEKKVLIKCSKVS